MTDIRFPAHFTPEDITRINQVRQWMQTNNYSQGQLARRARLSASTISQILRGLYATSPTPMLDKIFSAIENQESDASTVEPVKTSVYNMAHTCCRMARRYHNFVVFSGYVGTGKTYALRHYAKTHPNTHMIEATPTMTPASLIRQLSSIVAGFTGPGSINDRFQSVIDTLRDTDSLLIVDEAETLTATQLQTFRRIRDLANIGILLSGTEHLSGLIKPAHGQFDQIRSRVGFWPETIRGITEIDAELLIESAFDDDIDEVVVNRLYRYCKGSARMLMEGLVAGIKEFRKDNPLDVRLVDAVAKQALCLQSLA